MNQPGTQSGQKKLNSQKIGKSVILGVAFVWFTTHFGGGFASGAQLFSYFMPYGLWAFLMPVLVMAYNAFFFGYALRYARKHELYDYKSYNDSFYGKYKIIFSNLFEVLYLVTMLIPPAVAFATGGSTLQALTGIPYILCTLIIGVFIFIVAIFGTNIVRKVSFALSIVIVGGLLVVYIPNIIANWDTITANISATAAKGAEGNPFGRALWNGFIYGTFQLANIAVFVQHAQVFKSPKDSNKTFFLGWIINAGIMVMCVLGLFTVSGNEGIQKVAIPILEMVKSGVGSAVLTPIISILIILGAATTAVNMVAAMVARITGRFENPEKHKAAAETGKVTRMTVIAALICCIVDFSVAQFGLIPLIAKGYSFIAYLAIPAILLPYIVHMIVTRFDTKKPSKLADTPKN